MASWVDVPEGCDFSLVNLPYGIFSLKNTSSSKNGGLRRICTAIGDCVLDLKGLAQEGLLASLGFDVTTLEAETLNAYAALGRAVHRRVREFLQDLLRADTVLGEHLRDHGDRRQRLLVPLADVTLHLPMDVRNYTDFFVGIHHARAGGRIFRLSSALTPNYEHIPLAYTGRASSVVVSGTSFHRPNGQYLVDGKPVFGPSQRVDFEVEFGALIAQGNALGEPVSVREAEDHIFGFVMLNDWSSRDIQRWESQPLGPLNGKNFCSTISPWVVTPEALEPYKTEPVLTNNPVLPYLDENNQGERYHVSTCNTRNVIFSFAQMIAHLTAGGCPMQTGDLIGSGTLSGTSLAEAGCLLEATEDGQNPIVAYAINDTAEKGQPSEKSIQRLYLEDGDEVVFHVGVDAPQKADARGISGRVGFGACRGTVLPARK
ncbi:fumarylacetoacetase [Sporothrix brasiliensis 5110]|uniref:Fumarylacetoacetase n=1 Tax=Sporothrix brasiliensis 5110 TaxID=1398154 RepID=A0A0C2F912_9PEZI|nr:fumarylacetoacetase [Sporothrix brasiliensis 5110]KIH87583.1 fumarylacetoacetase [Sporothrix brasiliensis 5110]